MAEVTREEVIQTMQEAAERMGLDLEDLQELIVEVLVDCFAKSKTLKQAIENGDPPKIKSIAHDIKGSTANYGLQMASELAFKIEKNSECATIEMVNELITRLEKLSTLKLEQNL